MKNNKKNLLKAIRILQEAIENRFDNDNKQIPAPKFKVGNRVFIIGDSQKTAYQIMERSPRLNPDNTIIWIYVITDDLQSYYTYKNYDKKNDGVKKVKENSLQLTEAPPLPQRYHTRQGNKIGEYTDSDLPFPIKHAKFEIGDRVIYSGDRKNVYEIVRKDNHYKTGIWTYIIFNKDFGYKKTEEQYLKLF